MQPLNYGVQDPSRSTKRDTLLVSALINTGSLWLYEGPTSQSPTPLLVSRLVARGMTAVAASGTRLQQPIGFAADIEKRGLNAGAVDPKGFWNGGVSD